MGNQEERPSEIEVVQIFPHKCCRCGMCCLSETCPTGQFVYQVGQYEPCPGLFWHYEIAICQIANEYPDHPELIGVGVGCCIKARARAGGKFYDFASLPNQTKVALAQRIKWRNEG